MKDYINYPVAFLYKPDCFPPELLLEKEKPFFHREEYPISQWVFSDFIGVKSLWHNVWTNTSKWSNGEIISVDELGRGGDDLLFENDYVFPMGPFFTLKDRLVCDNWIFIQNPDAFFEKLKLIESIKKEQAFLSGNNSMLKQTSLF